MWIRTDEDVSKFIARVKEAATGPTGLPSGGGMLDVVEHELRHAIREGAPGKAANKKWVVTTTLTPTNFNRPESRVVEAATGEDAREIVRHALRDLRTYDNGNPAEKYVYEVKPHAEPPLGRILGGA